MRLLPTRSCFDDAMGLLEQLVKEDPARARGTAVRLVHGILLGPDEPAEVRAGVDGVVPAGEPFAHAWVEEDRPDGTLVWTSGLREADRRLVYAAIPREEFLRSMRVQHQTSYTCLEVWCENTRTGHYGPWRPMYRALCRQTPDLGAT